MDKNGTINLLKPAGMTSHDGVRIIRKLTGQKRVGHTGTLDPMACGVLPICLGKSTRAIEYMDLNKKIYKCRMVFGVETDTRDIWGKVLRRDDKFSLSNFTTAEIMAAFNTQKGVIVQIPPKYSAIRVAGKRLYEYARRGEEVEIPKRTVKIFSLDIEDIDYEKNRITFYVKCSKGTYVRTICAEVGEALGTFAVMTSLIRMESNGFLLEDTVTIEELREEFENAGNIDSFLGDIYDKLEFMGQIEIPVNRRKWFVNGGRLEKHEYKVIRKADEELYDEHVKTEFDYFNTYVVRTSKSSGNLKDKESHKQGKNGGPPAGNERYDDNRKPEEKNKYDNNYDLETKNEFLGIAKIGKNKELIVCKIMV